MDIPTSWEVEGGIQAANLMWLWVRVVQVQHRYFLLVILTTSVGDDLEEFKAALMHAAGELALSVVVVGIGSADFGPLEVRLPLLLLDMRPAHACSRCSLAWDDCRHMNWSLS